MTLTTEPPAPEMPPRERVPSMPPRPVSFPQLPPSNGGLRRQSTRRNTYEIYPSTSDDIGQSQSPSMPIPALRRFPQPPPLTPVQQAPGGGVGGFTPTSPYHGPSRDYLHYPHRVDTMPSPRPDSGPPYYESADISGGIHAEVWPTYNKISQEFDEKRLEKWNKDLDVLLLFVSLMVGARHSLRSANVTVHRPPCFLPSSRPSSSGPLMIYNQITNNRRPYSSTSC